MHFLSVGFGLLPGFFKARSDFFDLKIVFFPESFDLFFVNFDFLMKTWNGFFILNSEGWEEVIAIDVFFFEGFLMVLFQLINSSIKSGIGSFLILEH